MKIKHRIPFHNVFFGIIPVVLVVIIFLGLIDINTVSAYNQEENLPIHGWVVCDDLGIGFVPGIGNEHQFRLCREGIWQVMAFCLEPGRPVPSIGTICELIDNHTFWCSDEVQLLSIYEIMATSTPAPTTTMTPTSTPTLVPTTGDQLPTITVTPTSRERSGGSGNFGRTEIGSLLLGTFVISIGITTVLIDWEKLAK